MSDATPILHIIAQPCWHADAYIVGNRSGLEALRDALTRALDGPSGSSGVAFLYANDGEGFVAVAAQCERLDDVPYGYTDEIAESDWSMPAWILRRAAEA